MNSEAIRSEVQITEVKQQSRESKRSQSRRHMSTAGVSCKGCLGNHYRSECPHVSTKCTFCCKKGHTAQACRARLAFKSHEVTAITCHVHNVNASKFRAHATLAVNGCPIRFRIDSGADITLVGQDTWAKLERPLLSKYAFKCTSVNGNELSICGSFTANFSSADCSTEDVILVLRGRNVSLLGGRVPYSLGLLSVSPQVEIASSIISPFDSLKSEFPALFSEGLGTCTKVVVFLHIKPDVVPTHLPARPVAIPF